MENHRTDSIPNDSYPVKSDRLLELRVDAAIAADPSLLDREAVGEAIFRARHGNERWKKRVERTRKNGVGILDYPYAGKKKKKVA
jgi:hypothetical protein